jgi:hypothetical protein
MRTEEQMRFQGIDPPSFKMDVSESELQKQIGNAMSLCVIERLLNKLTAAAGFVNQERPDRWGNGEAIRELEESRDETFMQNDDASLIEEKSPEVELGEIHY